MLAPDIFAIGFAISILLIFGAFSLYWAREDRRAQKRRAELRAESIRKRDEFIASLRIFNETNNERVPRVPPSPPQLPDPHNPGKRRVLKLYQP